MQESDFTFYGSSKICGGGWVGWVGGLYRGDLSGRNSFSWCLIFLPALWFTSGFGILFKKKKKFIDNELFKKHFLHAI